MNSNLRPMNLGEILDRTFQIYRVKFFVFAGIAAMPALAMMGVHTVDNACLHLNSLVHPSDRGDTLALKFIVGLFFYHISSFLGLCILPASVELTSKVILCENGTIRSSLQFAAKRWRSYLQVAVLKILAILVIPEVLIVVFLLVAAIFESIIGAVKSGAGYLAVFGLLLLTAGCTLFVWLGSCLSLAVPACALEGTTGTGALRRSWLLSKGSRFRIVFTWLMVCALGYLMMLSIQFLSWRLVNYFYHGHQIGVAGHYLYVEAVFLLYAAVSTFVRPIYSIALVLFYYDQRVRKEGYDIESMMEAAGMNVPETSPSIGASAVSVVAPEGQA